MLGSIPEGDWSGVSGLTSGYRRGRGLPAILGNFARSVTGFGIEILPALGASYLGGLSVGLRERFSLEA